MTVAECFQRRLPQVSSQPDHANNSAAILRTLFSHVLGMDSSGLILHWNQQLVSEPLEECLEGLIERYNKGEPLQYITGQQWFWKNCFDVGPGVLIPRPETEILVEQILEMGPRHARVIELGAGTGNIGISCLNERIGWEWHAYEKSLTAHSFAVKNSRWLSRPSAYHLYPADIFDSIQEHNRFDLVVSNPPYVRSNEIFQLSEQVLHEPPSALDGGSDGLSVIRRLTSRAAQWLKSDGLFVVEIDESQSKSVPDILAASGFSQIQMKLDLCGRERIISGRKTWTH